MKTQLNTVFLIKLINIWMLLVFPSALIAATITLNTSTTHQTMIGLEGTVAEEQLNLNTTSFSIYKDELFDKVVDDLGLNRIRLEIYSGTENPVDYFSQYEQGIIDNNTWVNNYCYKIVNDDADSNHINANGFQFRGLDYHIDYVVLPLKQRLEARGEKLYINLQYVNFTRIANTFTHCEDPNEYAEFMLATFQHIKSKYNWVPDSIEIYLEPDNTDFQKDNWTAAKIGNVIVSTSAKLKANGFNNVEISTPSCLNMSYAITWFNDMITSVPACLPLISEFSYHRYAGVYDASLQTIGSIAAQYGIRTIMSEHIGSSYDDLHKDIKIGKVSSWQHYGWLGYFLIDKSDPQHPVITLKEISKFFRQYFKFIRKDAVRIDASSDNSNFDPLAFINKGGKYVVVVKTLTGGSMIIKGLPAGKYGIKYTTDDGSGNAKEYDVDLLDSNLSAGQDLNTSIPDKGVITIYNKDIGQSGNNGGSNLNPFEKTRIFPNPFNPAAASRGKIKITDIPISCVLEIYNATGGLIRSLNERDFGDNGWMEWDGKNQSGELVPSSIYYYMIQDAVGNTKKGKIAIVK